MRVRSTVLLLSMALSSSGFVLAGCGGRIADASSNASEGSAPDGDAGAFGADAQNGVGGDGAAAQGDYACTPEHAPTSCTTSAKYADVAPIFEGRCASCHSGVPNGPWPLRSYDAVAAWSDDLSRQLRTCAMPPADAGASLTTAERQLIVAWLACGAPK